MKKVSDASVRGLPQDVIPDRLRATSKDFRHNVKVYCDSNGLSHRCWYIACWIYLLVVCLQSVPDPSIQCEHKNTP